MNTTLQPALGYTVFHETASFTEAVLLWSDITWLSRKIQEPVREVSLLHWSLWNICLVIKIGGGGWGGEEKNWEIQTKLSKWRTFYSWSRAINYLMKLQFVCLFYFKRSVLYVLFSFPQLNKYLGKRLSTLTREILKYRYVKQPVWVY